jgi:HAMP domain-containing protein
VARGDLSRKITVDVKGEILELKNTINTMVDQLSSFAAEVTRVAREVGTEGKLGGQAKVKGVAGTWKDLTDSVNSMAGNLTGQVRNIAEVTTAVANGRPFEEDHGGREGRGAGAQEHHQHDGGPAAVVCLGVTRVAREVGTEGSSGGQAKVEGVSGTWKDLTDSVNSDGRQPHRAGAQHRGRDDGRGQGRPLAQDHGGREGRDPRSSRTPSTRWWTSSRRSPRK